MHNRLSLAKRNGIIRVAVATLLALAAVPAALARTNGIDVAGADLARALTHKRIQSVAVVDFSGPGNRVSALDQQLADQLTAVIANAGGKLRIEDRSQVSNIRTADSYAPEIVLDDESLALFAKDLKVDCVIAGRVSPVANGVLDIALDAYRASDGQKVAALKATVAVTPEITSLMTRSASAQSDSLVDFTKKPSPAASGYKPPQCLWCPRANYTPEALGHKIQGAVYLTAVIGTDGRATDIAVSKGLPDGLTASSINALKIWRLTPASAPDGKSIPCRDVIEMTFQMGEQDVRP